MTAPVANGHKECQILTMKIGLIPERVRNIKTKVNKNKETIVKITEEVVERMLDLPVRLPVFTDH